MPSLFRFLILAASVVAAVYIAMLALVAFVQPQEREIVQTVPAEKFK